MSSNNNSNIQLNKDKLKVLIKDCVTTANFHSVSKDKLDKFCMRQWGFIFTDSDDFGVIDPIVDSVDYGHNTITVEKFINIMNEIQKERKEN